MERKIASTNPSPRVNSEWLLLDSSNVYHYILLDGYHSQAQSQGTQQQPPQGRGADHGEGGGKRRSGGMFDDEEEESQLSESDDGEEEDGPGTENTKIVR